MCDQIKNIQKVCMEEQSRNPVEIAKKLMKLEGVSIHGPEHHILDGSALLTAMHNVGAEFDLEKALHEMEVRGRKMPGATCGQWGMCGSSASVGAALAIIHETGPLSDNEFYKDNLRLTSEALGKIAEVGGPRCCKRNAFLSLKTAVEFVNRVYGLQLEDSDIHCEFSPLNQQCIKECCPFYK